MLGITRQAAEKRWGYAQLGMKRVAGVISRRDRVHDDGQGRSYGEVGGNSQYDSDRQEWPVGKVVRGLARYWIVAVDGTVQRVYTIDPGSWKTGLARRVGSLRHRRPRVHGRRGQRRLRRRGPAAPSRRRLPDPGQAALTALTGSRHALGL